MDQVGRDFVSWSQEERERQQKKRDAFRAQGLTSKGKQRKPRYKPSPHQAMRITKDPAKPVSPDQPKAQPRTPMSILRKPLKLPRMTPVTEQDRRDAA